MRGNRTWFALAINWFAIACLLVIANLHAAFFIAGIIVIIVSFFIASGDMRWWKADTENLNSAMRQLTTTGQQIAAYRKVVRDAPVIKGRIVE